jgi:putative transposase
MSLARSGRTCTRSAIRSGRRNSRVDDYRSFNALAETVHGLYKTELINRRGPWRTVNQVELATARWVDFWNTQRLHSACGDVPPAEFEAAYHARQVTGEAA